MGKNHVFSSLACDAVGGDRRGGGVGRKFPGISHFTFPISYYFFYTFSLFFFFSSFIESYDLTGYSCTSKADTVSEIVETGRNGQTS